MSNLKGRRFPTDVILVCVRWYCNPPLPCPARRFQRAAFMPLLMAFAAEPLAIAVIVVTLLTAPAAG